MAANAETLSRLQEISDDQWRFIIKQLIIYAELRLDKIGFTPRSELDSITGEDFAMEAIKKVFEGIRSWDSTKYPDLLIHLKLVVKSLIWSHIKSSMKATVETADTPVFENAQESDDPEALIITQERWQQIEALFGDDFDGFIFFSDWLDETPPRKIAEKYTVEIGAVNNAIKKGKGYVKRVYSN